MSVNRENVTWQSRDGTWNLGHFDFYEVNDDSEDFDYEWDVEYVFDRFHWVTTGHPTPEAARDAWDGANPGGTMIFSYAGHEETVAKYEAMVVALRERRAA